MRFLICVGIFAVTDHRSENSFLRLIGTFHLCNNATLVEDVDSVGELRDLWQFARIEKN